MQAYHNNALLATDTLSIAEAIHIPQVLQNEINNLLTCHA